MTESVTESPKLTLPGVSIGHGCNDCFRLTVEPAYWHSAGASYHPVAVFTAGHGGEPHPEVGSAGIALEDLPELIRKLQDICDQQNRAGDHFVPGWLIDH